MPKIRNQILVTFVVATIFSNTCAYCETIDPTASRLPYCGLYCIYTVMRAWDTNPDFRYLLKNKYISNYQGSTLGELKQAAIDHQLFAECVDNLTIRSLKSSKLPMILHVKSSMKSPKYDHYVLFLGIEGSVARIYSPPHPIKYVPLHEIRYIWSGAALIVSNNPIALHHMLFKEKLMMLSLATVLAVALFLFHVIKIRWLAAQHLWAVQVRYAAIQFGCILLVTFVASFLAHYFCNGFLSYPEAVEHIQTIHAGQFIPKITKKQAYKHFVNRSLFIDVRFSTDFIHGHIGNAINLPINCSDEHYAQTISGLPKDKMIVLYCQSAGCKFAETMAIRLKDDGFSNVAVFRGGWVEWQKINGAQSAKTEGQKDENKV